MNEYMRNYKILGEILNAISADTWNYLENDVELSDLVLKYKGMTCRIPLDYANINNVVTGCLTDIHESVKENITPSDVDEISFKDIEPYYTGGGIWCFDGELSNGTFFQASDFMDSFRILNADPRGLDEADFEDWQEEHLIKDIDEDETAQIFVELYRWLESHKPDCGIDFESEIRERTADNE